MMKYAPQHGPAPLRSGRYRRGSIAKRLRAWILERDGHRCLDCGEADPAKLTMDHLWPAVAGGIEMASNLETVCQSCNSRRKQAWERMHGPHFYPSRPWGYALLNWGPRA